MDDAVGLAPAGSASRIVPRRAAVAPQDSLFIALLNGFRSSGGLQRLSVVQAIRRNAWSAKVVAALPERITDRSVLGITWNHEAWVPDFQFDAHGSTKQAAAAAFRELVPGHDPWELAGWFVSPSTWLQHERPIDLLEVAPATVLAAARADRFVANGGWRPRHTTPMTYDTPTPTIRRRSVVSGLAAAAIVPPLAARTVEPASVRASPIWSDIEHDAGGRLGVAILDTGLKRMSGHRLDERFPMCSTFKWLAAACVLHRVDAGVERLDRRIRYGPEVLLEHSPATALHAGGKGMTLRELCEATVALSDNAAANLILDSFGGPAALTRFARSIGDLKTRLDRREPELNEALPGDPRDTTTPRAMANSLRAAVLGDSLAPASRDHLSAWLESTRTNLQRLRADLPSGWRMGSKTGTGPKGTTNDVGVFWPPGRAPIVVAVYLTGSLASLPVRERAVARVAATVTGAS